MIAAPDRRGLTRPAPEGAAEGADLGVVQDLSNLAERQVRLGEQRAGNLAADPVGHLPKCAAFGFQVSVQGPAGHRVEAGDHVRRTGIPDEFDPKRALHLLGERLGHDAIGAGLPCGGTAFPSQQSSAAGGVLVAWDSLVTVWDPRLTPGVKPAGQGLGILAIAAMP